jgi:hypothetical protein
VRTDPGHLRRLVVVLGSAAVLAIAVVVARNSAAESDTGPRAGSAPLPAALAGRSPAPANTSADPPGLPAADRAAIAAASAQARRLNKPGVPVELVIPIPTPNHPNGVHARVTANALNQDGTLHVPADPTTVSWARQDAAPGSSHGTAILTSHINYVINGHLVIGALSDLALYAQQAIGKTITLRLADHRVLHYRIVAGREYTKDQLAASPRLRAELYNQKQVYGPAGHPSGRLLLVSCGGAFDPYTGEYQDNVFLYALPEF